MDKRMRNYVDKVDHVDRWIRRKSFGWVVSTDGLGDEAGDVSR